MLFVWFCFLSSGAAQAAQPGAVQVNKIAAVINGEIVTLHELRRQAGPDLARRGVDPTDPKASAFVNAVLREALELVINNILLRQEAQRLKITVSDSEVDNEWRKLVQRNQTTEQDFEARLAAQGMSVEMVKDRLRNNILSQRIVGIMIARKVVVTKDEIRKYYEEHRKEFGTARSVDMSLLIFGPSVDIESVAAGIKNNKMSFEEAVRRYSMGPAADKGGKLARMAWDDLALPLKAELARLTPGEVSPVFLLDRNPSLVRLDALSPGEPMSLEQAAPEIERILREPRLEERFEAYTAQLRAKAVIDVRL
jgi:peptidyl-prolyl cis-trans isomerase SurA